VGKKVRISLWGNARGRGEPEEIIGTRELQAFNGPRLETKSEKVRLREREWERYGGSKPNKGEGGKGRRHHTRKLG